MKKILHIDDDADILSSVKTILDKRGGFEVTNLYSGAAALKDIESNDYSLILLDVMLPDMSGWEISKRILKMKPDSKIIFMSVLELTAEKEKEIAAAGVKDYIRKPFDQDDLVERIMKAIKS